MTICPIAIAVGCQKCPVFKVCPLKSVLGDVPKADIAKPATPVARKAGGKTRAKPAPARKKSSK